MKKEISKSKTGKKERSSLTKTVAIRLIIVIIALILFIIPWYIPEKIPAVPTYPGYTGDSMCANTYAYVILFGAAFIISIFNWYLSNLINKDFPSQKKLTFIIFETTLLLSTALAAYFQHSFCDVNSWHGIF
jgi:hypothetical protein